MKIGLLEAENLKPEIIKTYGSYANMTARLLQAVKADLSFQTYPVINGGYPDTIDECDAYLITGSKASAYDDDDWITQLENYIQTLVYKQKKLIGICFGHQLIAQALGGKVAKSDKGWGVGVMNSQILLEKPWMTPYQPSFSLLVSHQDQVAELPVSAERIASNEHCLNSSYLIGQHVLSFQGHPEFSVDYARQSMEGRRELIGEERYQQRLKSLADQTDHLLVAKWIVNFLR
ncbi:MAG: GMP synthase [Gammaproteobacteria bacterium]|nr:GMP synthase [Gammaproteobacteria bacterium]